MEKWISSHRNDYSKRIRGHCATVWKEGVPENWQTLTANVSELKKLCCVQYDTQAAWLEIVVCLIFIVVC